MGVVKNLMVRAGADFSAITKQANKAKSSMSSMERSVSQSCSKMSAATSTLKKAFSFAAVTAAVTATVAAAKNAKAAYDEQAEADTKLAQVMRNTMGATAGEVAAIQDLIAAQETLGVVSGDAQTQGAQELATYLGMSSSLKTLIPVLNDMAAQQYGIGASAESVVSIATMMGKVMQGQTSALSRYGYTFTAAQEAILKYGTEAQRAAVLAEVVGESVGGMNAALAATPDGRLLQVSNRLGEIQEKFGGAVNSVLTLFLPAMNLACNALDVVANIADRAAQAVANVFGTKAATTSAVRYTGAVSGAVEEVESAAVGAKKAMGELYGFDQITKLKDTGTSGGAANIGGVSAGTVTEVPVEIVPVEDGSDSLGWLETWLAKVQAKAATIDLSPAKTALERLKTAVTPICETMFDGLDWAIDNVLFPLATWGVESALPAFLDMLAGGADLLTGAITFLQPGATWLWDNFLQPIASWTGGAIVTVLQDTADLLSDIGGLLSGKVSFGDFISQLTPVQTAIAGIATACGFITLANTAGKGLNTVLTFIEGVKSGNGVIGKLYEVFTLTAGGAGTLSEAVKAVFGPGSIIAGIAGILGGAVVAFTNFKSMLENGFSWANEALMLLGVGIAAVGAVILGAPATVAAAVAGIVAAVGTAAVLIKEHWTEIQSFFLAAWDGIRAAGSAALDNIKALWGSVTSWFKANVTDPLSSGVWNFANGAIGSFEGLVNGGISGVNKLIGAINKISFDVPEWVPVIGGKEFGFDLKTVSKVTLPRLATGGVVTTPTTALIGEAGPEAVVPLKDNAPWMDVLAGRIRSRFAERRALTPSANTEIHSERSSVVERMTISHILETVRAGMAQAVVEVDRATRDLDTVTSTTERTTTSYIREMVREATTRVVKLANQTSTETYSATSHIRETFRTVAAQAIKLVAQASSGDRVRLPHLASGGVVTSPTRALIGEAGPEAIVPLKDHAAWLDALALRIAGMMGGGQRPISLTLPVYIGGRKVTTYVINDINEMIETTGVCPIKI